MDGKIIKKFYDALDTMADDAQITKEEFEEIIKFFNEHYWALKSIKAAIFYEEMGDFINWNVYDELKKDEHKIEREIKNLGLEEK